MTKQNAIKYLENRGFVVIPIIIQCELAGGHVTCGWKAQKRHGAIVKEIRSETVNGLVRIHKKLFPICMR